MKKVFTWRPIDSISLLLICLLALLGQDLIAPPGGQAAATSPVIKYSKSMSADALAGRPDSALVELTNGRKIRLGDVRRLTALGKRMRAAVPGIRALPALQAKPAASGLPLRNSNDITVALKRPDTETLQLPSGKTLTVGQLKLVQAEVERQLGHSLASLPQRPDLTGPSITISKSSDWKSLLKKTDSTVLEAPDGTRITVGELKQTLAETSMKPAAPPRKR